MARTPDKGGKDPHQPDLFGDEGKGIRRPDGVRNRKIKGMETPVQPQIPKRTRWDIKMEEFFGQEVAVEPRQKTDYGINTFIERFQNLLGEGKEYTGKEWIDTMLVDARPENASLRLRMEGWGLEAKLHLFVREKVEGQFHMRGQPLKENRWASYCFEKTKVTLDLGNIRDEEKKLRLASNLEGFCEKKDLKVIIK